jgi:hypothetical protein
MWRPWDSNCCLDESEGYAYLRQRTVAEGEPELPRLVPRRQLGLSGQPGAGAVAQEAGRIGRAGRRHPADPRPRADRRHGAGLSARGRQRSPKLMDRLDAHVNKIVDMGFLRRLRGKDDQFEVRRILKAFVDAQWLGEFDRRLADYATRHRRRRQAGRRAVSAGDRSPTQARWISPHPTSARAFACTGWRSTTGARSTTACGRCCPAATIPCSPATSVRASRR